MSKTQKAHSTQKQYRILILEDSPLDVELILHHLRSEGVPFVSSVAVSETEYLDQLRTFQPDLVLADYRLPSYDGLAALTAARRHSPQIGFILLSGVMGDELVTRSLRHGADDCISKNRLRRLRPAVRKVLQKLELTRQNGTDPANSFLSYDGARILLNHAQDACYVTDLNGVFLDGNLAAETLSGYPREELLGRSWMDLDLLEPEDLTAAKTRLHRMLKGFSSGPYAYWVRRKDGNRVKVEIQNYPITLDGKLVILGIARDLTEHDSLQRQLTVYSELGSGLSAARTALEAGEIILEAADKLLGWDACTVDLYDADRDVLTDVVSKDLVDGRRETCQRLEDRKPSPLARRILDRKRGELFLRSKPEDELPHVLPFGDTSRASLSILCAPILNHGNVIGLMSLHSYSVGAYDKSDLEAVQALAHHCAGALERIRAQEAFQESARLLRLMFDNSMDAVFVHEAPASGTDRPKFIEVNNVACQRLGYSREELLTMSPVDLTDPEFNPSVISTAKKLLTTKEEVLWENVLITKDGRKFPVEGATRNFEMGGRKLCLSTVRDVSARRESEAQLRLLGTALESAANAIMITDREGRIQWANAAFERLTGYAAQEVQGLSPAILKSGYHSSEVYKKLWDTILSGQVWHSEMVNRRKNGIDYMEENTITPVRDSQGRITHFISVKQDITARRRAEEQILSQASLLQIAQDAISVHDFSGQVIFWNNRATQLYGYDLEDLLGKNLEEILLGGHSTVFEEAKQVTLERGEWSGEVTLKAKDGRQVIVHSRWSLVRDRNQQPSSFLVVSTDITEKKTLEAQLMRAQRLESIGRLASGVAHDLNNMLTPVMMAVQLLRDSRTGDSDQVLLETLETCVKRGADIVKQVLLFARGSTEARMLLPPRRLVQEMCRILQETFPRSIQVRTEFCREPWPIKADATQIQQVLMNLCVNARDAMPEGGTLTVGIANEVLTREHRHLHPKAGTGPYIVLTVQDTGSGISPEVFDKIFDPFFTTKPVGQGTGLGLPTTMAIAESHGGFLRVETKLGEGSRFMVYLPASDVPEFETPVRVPTSSFKGAGELVLVVDDELAIRELVRAALETSGYTVAVAPTGDRALQEHRFLRGEVQVVIMDMMMPGMCGVPLVKRFLAVDPKIKIIAISGLGAELSNLQAEVPEVHAILRKPFSAHELLEAVCRALKPADPQVSS